MTRTTLIRSIIVGAGLGFLVQNWMMPWILPYGPAIKIDLEDRHKCANIDFTKDYLQAKHGRLTKIYERNDSSQPHHRLMKGPESVVINPATGTIYVLTEEGNLVRLSDLRLEENNDDETAATIMTAQTTLTANLGVGRPLGGQFTMDGTILYVADAGLGLIRIQDPENYPKSKVELVANRVQDGDEMTPILYANDVAVGPKTGMVYFTDSTDIDPERIESGRTWDTLYASKLDYARGKKAGRLLRYDPKTQDVTVLARNISFANGIAVDEEETYVFMAETFRLRLLKYHLTGPQEGGLDVILDSHYMTGYPDNVDCAWKSRGGELDNICYAAIPSSVLKLAKMWSNLPHPLDKALRTLAMSVPKWAAPKVVPYGAIVEVNASQTVTKDNPSGGYRRLIQDPIALDVGMLNSATFWDDRLYLGSLKNDFIGVYRLK